MWLFKRKIKEDSNPVAETIKLPVQDFFEKYKYGLSGELGQRVLDQLWKARRDGVSYMTIPKSDFEQITKKQEEIIRFNNLLNKTAELNNKGIEFEKQGKIDEAIGCYEENIKLKQRATHAYERLMILYHKRGDYENEKRVIKIAMDVYSDGCDNYKKRLAKLDGTYKKPDIILPSASIPYIVSGIPLGLQFENTVKLLPEFNFYYDMPVDETTSVYLWKHSNLVNDGKFKPEICRIQKVFRTFISDAQNFEEAGRLDKAAEVYERIIAEKYYLPAPFDELITIYSKAKLKDDEMRVLQYSINHFTELKKRQMEYILTLANKYGKLNFAKERIANNKKIMYYGGAFELYNPFTILEKWKSRISKLETQKIYL